METFENRCVPELRSKMLKRAVLLLSVAAILVYPGCAQSTPRRKKPVEFRQPISNALPVGLGGFTAKPTTKVNAGALVTWFVAQKKTVLLPGAAGCPSTELFEEKPAFVVGQMARHGPQYLCTVGNNLMILISETSIAGYSCTSLSSESGCMRRALWWSVWYKWNSVLPTLGITADDIRLNRKVTMTEKQYSNMIRLFWKVFHDGNIPVESTAVHSLHGHSIPKYFLTVPRVTRGGGAFGAPVWHQSEDPCVKDTLDIIFRNSNKIARPCKAIVYDGSGFYVSNPDLLSSTALGPECNHDCGFRYYYGNTERGQIIAYKTSTSKLNNLNEIEGAILDHF